jgi:hypothetical protein
MVRFLAHGGTLLEERARKGTWPAIHPLLLEEKYGLEEEKPVIGVGLKAGSPFLIFRELQRNIGRLYAFTLLLDPGESVWNLFAWNPAKLIFAIVQARQTSHAEAVLSRLFQAPEGVGESELEECLSGLETTSHSASSTGEPDTLTACLAGSAISSELLSVNPQDLGMTSRPSIEALLASFDGIPSLLRIGRGWMSGGGTAQAEEFGAGIVFDDSRPKKITDVKPLAQKGSLALKQLDLIRHQPQLQDLLAQVLPSWKWSSPARDFSTLAPVVEWLTGTGDAKLIGKLAANGADGPFSELVQKAAEIAVLGGKSPLDGEITRRVVRQALARGESLKPLASRLDVGALSEVLRQECNSAIPPTLELPPEFHLRLALYQLNGADVGSLPKVLTDYLLDPAWPSDDREQLFDVAWGRYQKQPEVKPLSQWAAVGALFPEGLQSIRDEVKKRVKSGEGPFIRDYLEFGGVEVAVLLKALQDYPLDKAVTEVLDRAKANSDSRSDGEKDRISEIACALSAPKFRRSISIVNKKRLADVADGDPSWAAFQVLCRLMEGEEGRTVQVAEAEAAELRKELPQLAGNGDRRTPNLKALLKWDGVLDKATLRILFDLYARNGWQRTESWSRGLDLAGKKDWLDETDLDKDKLDDIEQRILEDRQWDYKPLLDSSLLPDRLYNHLFGDKYPRDESIAILRAICIKLGGNGKFQEALRRAISQGLNGPRTANFGTRFFFDPPEETATKLEPIFSAMQKDPDQPAKMIEALFSNEQNDVVPLINDVLEKQDAADAFNKAVLEFVSKSGKTALIDIVAKIRGKKEKALRDEASSLLKAAGA